MRRKFREFDWLSLLEVSGPFLSPIVIKKTFPQGLDAHRPDLFENLKLAYSEWNDAKQDPEIQREWIKFVLKEVLSYPVETILRGQSLPQSLKADAAEYGEVLRPDLAIVNPSDLSPAGKSRVLMQILPPGVDLAKPLPGKRWKESPAGRMAILLRGVEVRLGLITNGEQWMLVNSKRGENPGYISWYANLWLEEKDTLRAFRSLLGAMRIFGVSEKETLEAMLEESIESQQEVTDLLGLQTRRAVEILVQSIDRSDREMGGELLRDVPVTEVYEAALTFMMRLVFLFSAEERDLLPMDSGQYQNFYAASTLRENLREIADQYGEEVLERRNDAWQRLLALFRAVHSGITHEDLRLPPYGGHLFDPDRYPFLEGRTRGTSWKDTAARSLSINNRTVLHVLEALQILREKGDAQKLSFRALDIEQIGHVYEGLLDHTAKRALEPVVSLSGKAGAEPELPLSELEAASRQGQEKLIELIREVTNKTEKSTDKSLKTELTPEEDQLLLKACENNRELFERIHPFGGIVRKDSYGDPAIFPKGSLYVTEGSSRRSSSTYYTPRSLTESIVKHTLDPLIYMGPAEGKDPSEWKVRTAREILALKICDFTCGSGAFLVQACRYLAERLTAAWEEAESAHPGQVVITPEGDLSEGSPADQLIPKETQERLVLARRLVADRCLYGVDKNPLAVEMAKLSLWLITLQKDRPFTFLDHAIKCGDSLLGITNLQQLKEFHLDTEEEHRQLSMVAKTIEEKIVHVRALREQLAKIPVLDIKDAEYKEQLLLEADQATRILNDVSDALTAVFLAEPKGGRREARLKAFATAAEKHLENPSEINREFLKDVCEMLNNGLPQGEADRNPFHWALQFPEVFLRNGLQGFDALIGNPPFKGGKKITGDLGIEYREYLIEQLADGQKGNSDLCGYFFLRAHMLLRDKGTFGLLATNTIAQGDTREVGLDQIASQGSSIYRAVPSRKWPGGANLEVAHVWLFRGGWAGKFVLEDQHVNGISPYLSIPSRVQDRPYPLKANEGKSFIGSYILGMGFVMEPEEAEQLIAKNNRNRDVLFPYLNGEDLNSRPDQSPSRWVINFFDWPLNRSAPGSWKNANEKQRKEWRAQGLVPSDYDDPVAADYPECLTIVEEKVKPERTRKQPDGSYVLRKPLPQKWWIYADKRPALYTTIKGMERVLVRAQVSRTWEWALVPNEMVYDAKLIVFSLPNWRDFAVLQSTLHWEWSIKYGTTLRLDMSYTPTTNFETFPFPTILTAPLELSGEEYYQFRKQEMANRNLGMTGIYNRLHNKAENDRAIDHLRELRVHLDEMVAQAYGWSDICMNHSFYGEPARFTVSPQAQNELLNRLLALNLEIHDDEMKLNNHNGQIDFV